MNILHLKYAMEVARVGSINKAAENLYLAQPNLSRAIKSLESSLGITIFVRTSKGMTLTSDGEKLLQASRGALNQLDQIEKMFQNESLKRQQFSISVPRASYIAEAFAQFTKQIKLDTPAEFYYQETDSLSVINNVLDGSSRLGIVRYATVFDRFYREMIREKFLNDELIAELSYNLVFSRQSPLAGKQSICYQDLKGLIEIAHSDAYVPSLSETSVQKEELPDCIDKRIFLFERGGQFDVLSANPFTFMWVSQIPNALLEKHRLLQRTCEDNRKTYRDVLIYQKEYKPTKLDRLFLEELGKAKDF